MRISDWRSDVCSSDLYRVPGFGRLGLRDRADHLRGWRLHRKMKALVYTGPGTVDYREVEDPAPQAGESLLRVEACCICGSDMHAFHGRDERRKPPLILGHEAVGTVLAGPLPGTRVVGHPLVSCGPADSFPQRPG